MIEKVGKTVGSGNRNWPELILIKVGQHNSIYLKKLIESSKQEDKAVLYNILTDSSRTNPTVNTFQKRVMSL